jgi:oligopeptide/dipeptide ABC transporter ATP-binding protein
MIGHPPGTCDSLPRDERAHSPTPALLSARSLVHEFPLRRGLRQRVYARVHAVDNITIDVYEGETLGLVGESGCGKSTLGRCLMRLLEPTSGEITFDGQRIERLGRSALRPLRRDMQMVFQNPYASLNPRKRVGDIIAEPLRIHRVGTAVERRRRVEELLATVGLSPEHARRYPHEFSGGQRQRIGIARALALRPRLVIADEPVSALDVSIQAQILNLFSDLQDELALTYVIVSHDLGVIRHISDRVAVMYLGKIVEHAPATRLFAQPIHPYTEALLAAAPIPDPGIAERRSRVVLQGDVPSAIYPPSGCRFHTRCPYATDRCRIEEPPLQNHGQGHEAACHYPLGAPLEASAGPARSVAAG